MNDLSPILWKGRQWAVTDYGLETISKPYHYYFTVQQLGEFGIGQRADRFDSMIYAMEKDWLDVDDFITAYLVAVTMHGVPSSPTVVRDSLRGAMRERASLYKPRRGQVPRPPGGGVYSMSEMEKFLPEPPWHGSQVLGAQVGGAVEDVPQVDEDDR